MSIKGYPVKQGLYDPQYEHDACGVGFVVDIAGNKSHRTIHDALQVLVNLDHRGARGSEVNTGDGAGIMLQIPHRFFSQLDLGFVLPAEGKYGVGMFFLPPDPAERQCCEELIAKIVADEGQRLLGWRTVPVANDSIGNTALLVEPCMRQIFIEPQSSALTPLAFERKLYVIRKRIEFAFQQSSVTRNDYFYAASLSARTIVYKGMLTPQQVIDYFPDLRNEAMESALALVHSRFSTNTFPSWERAHPNRYVIHNGEINTLRGNVNWMHAREMAFVSEAFGDDLAKVLPIIDQNGSDSSMFDNVFEFLVLAGRSLPHTAMMMIPEPWANHESMSAEKQAFYEYHSCLMEPWDGPASIAFTDGSMVGAVLDRNGLRPSRYYVTKDGMVIMASEVGVLDIPADQILHKGRLQPGRMLLIDTVHGKIVNDDEIKRQIANEHPYREWLDGNMITLDSLPSSPAVLLDELQPLIPRLQTFGYSLEDMQLLLAPMAREGQEPIGAMGVDSPLAVLSDQPQLLYNYFKQIFAQVTNPPIDSIREEIVTAMGTTIGAEGDLLHPGPENCRQIKLDSPLITNQALERLRNNKQPDFTTTTLPILFDPLQGGQGLQQAMEELCALADKAIAAGVTFIILSDRGINSAKAPIPALLAVSGLHHHLIRKGTRTKIGLVLESGEPREVQHFALLIGYGCGAINPYLALEAIQDMVNRQVIKDINYRQAEYQYLKGAAKGVVKTMSKMGISTIQSYRGAQIFEAMGLNRSLIDNYFTWTPSRIAGIGLTEIAEEIRRRHQIAYPEFSQPLETLASGGFFKWRSDGEYHLYNPETIHHLQTACRNGDYKLFKEYTTAINSQSTQLCTLRGLLDFKKEALNSIPLAEVESVEAICHRFKTGAMSYGSISQEAHEAMAIAMNRIGGKSNTGEGGEDPERFNPLPNGDSRCSAIKQVASGRFGVTSNYLVNAIEIQIKMAQGAKPGEGGQLPGQKVYPWIARVRHSTPGVGLISPPPHHDIYSIEDLAELIHDLKNANRHARISVKLVSEVGVGTIAAGVAKAHADVVLISGYDGGTGASPRSSIRHAGMPWELGLAETHQTLLLNNLRSRICVETDGKLLTGRDVVIAALLGAEEYGFATTPLIVLGCVMMRVCHLDTCPVGVATQNPELRACFNGDPAHVVNFMRFIAEDMREIMAQLGFRTINEMIGRVDVLQTRDAIDHWKASGLDLSPILYRPDVAESTGVYSQIPQDHGLTASLDLQVLLPACASAIENGQAVSVDSPISNVNRVVGTILGSEVSRRYGEDGLLDDTIQLNFHGSAGQSFGAFVPRGITMTLVGDANDYLGKGLSGGKIIVYPPEEADFSAEDNIIIGNVALYGATSGEAYFNGLAGERFCVRNSGVHAVVEGIGDHGCEYMTGGSVVVLGPTGRNFAAGMSGGVAYLYDAIGDFPNRCNMSMVELEPLQDEKEITKVYEMIMQHIKYTNSSLARSIIADWDRTVEHFVRVMPKDYARVYNALERAKESGLTGEEAWMFAFEENIRDVTRVGGN